MQKLNLHNTAEIVLYAVRKGLLVETHALHSLKSQRLDPSKRVTTPSRRPFIVTFQSLVCAIAD